MDQQPDFNDPAKNNRIETGPYYNISKRTAWLIVVFALLAIIASIVLSLDFNKPDPTTPPVPTPPTDTPPITEEVSFETRNLNDAAYEITYSVPTGNSQIEVMATDTIEQIVDDFIRDAETDREEAVAEMGELPTYLQRPYSLDISNTYYKSDQTNTQTIATTIYSYTGGANGVSYYDISTVHNEDEINDIESIVSLADQSQVKNLIVEALESKEFGDQLGSQVLFPEALQNLELEDIQVGFDSSQARFYFGEYLVGPGVLGSFSVDIALEDIEPYLEL